MGTTLLVNMFLMKYKRPAHNTEVYKHASENPTIKTISIMLTSEVLNAFFYDKRRSMDSDDGGVETTTSGTYENNQQIQQLSKYWLRYVNPVTEQLMCIWK